MCGSKREQLAAQLQWKTVMQRPAGGTIAMGSGGDGSAKDGWMAEKLQLTMITAMGNCGLRRALRGVVAEGGSHPPPPE